jgi:hypothetical protein
MNMYEASQLITPVKGKPLRGALGATEARGGVLPPHPHPHQIVSEAEARQNRDLERF